MKVNISMKKVVSFFLAASLLFCFFSCEKEEKLKEKSAYEIYTEAFDLTADLSYQKFNITYETLYPTGNTNVTTKGPIFCKLINKDGAISFYSERKISVSNDETTITPTFYHHYIDGVMYQTLESKLMKHTLDKSEFEKKNPGFHNIMVSFPSDLVKEYGEVSGNDEGGKSVSYYIENASLLEKSEIDKLKEIFDTHSSHSYDGSYSIDMLDILIETDFDGYFCYYMIQLQTSDDNGNCANLKIKLDIINPGSHFVMNGLVGSKNDYIDGSFEIN